MVAGQARSLHKLEQTILGQITKSTARGKQRNIGPSEIAGCALCVGETLALKLPEQYPDIEHTENFGLGAWLGTGMHTHIENTFDVPGAILEKKLTIGVLEGYGTISGSCDFFLDGHVVDWKNPGKFSYDAMRLEALEKPNQIPKTVYRGQSHLYGLGWENAGHEVKTVSLCVIPKLHNDPAKIKFYHETYNRKFAEAAFKRLELIWQYVQDNRLTELPSAGDDCYTCSRVLMRA